jgi:hypothetical protein
MSFYKLRRNELDPLDHEILERAFEAAWEAIKGSVDTLTLKATRNSSWHCAASLPRSLA